MNLTGILRKPLPSPRDGETGITRYEADSRTAGSQESILLQGHTQKHETACHDKLNRFNGLNVEPKDSMSLPKKSWRAPCVMVSSLFIGLILALIHHAMNIALNGQVVNGTGLTSQRWTLRYATALAFLVKACFVICIGAAYVQRQWLNISTRQQSIMVKDLDKLFNGLSDIFSLFAGSAWRRNPLLWLLAVISWTIPFAVVVTPGTLNVEPSPMTNTTTSFVPRIDYHQNAYALVPTIDNHTFPNHSNVTHTQKLLQMVYQTVTASKILAMVPDSSNQSYSLNFFGPALKCKPANQSMTARVTNATFPMLMTYLAWSGDAVPWVDDSKPFVEPFTFQSLDNKDTWLDINETDGNSLWVYSNKFNNSVTFPITPDESSKFLGNLTECRLWNASYNVDFQFQNFEQTTVIRNLSFYNPVWITATNLTTKTNAAMEAETSGHSSDHLKDRLGSVLSYKAIMSAFGSLVVGADSANFFDPADHYLWYKESQFHLLNINFTAGRNAESLEQLLQNITLSLFSVPHFRNTTSAEISITTYPNTYIYDSRDLLLAYGFAFLSSLACCMLGLHSFFVSKNSYRNNFSSYIRAVEGSNLEIQTLVLPGDTGADPLPKQIGRKIITMRNKSTKT